MELFTLRCLILFLISLWQKECNHFLTTAILGDTVGGVSSVQDGSTAAHTLLSDEGAGALLIVLSVQTGAAGAGAHTRLILLTRGTTQRYNNTGVHNAWANGKHEHICTCTSLLPYGKNCAVSSWCRLDVCSRLPHRPPESHIGDPCSADRPPT